MLTESIRKYAVQNRLEHGKASENAIIGRIMAQFPEARGDATGVRKTIAKIVAEVNELPESELGADNSAEKISVKKSELTIPNAKNVVMRFAPNPSGPLHIGHARAVILNDELVKKYNGKLILRIEDTDPKRVDPQAYSMIEEDLKSLGVAWHEKIVQSGRLGIYEDYCRRLIEAGHAYVCDCDEDEFKKLKLKSKPCPHRGAPAAENLKLFDEMKNWPQGRASVKLKTDLKHNNPAVRDFPIMRVVEKEHPLVKGHKLYPLMNFSVAVDDRLTGVTHVLRGKDHIINTERQRYVYKYFGWNEPVFIHYGLMRTDVVLSTSDMRRGIESGKFSGWDDVSLWTIRALVRRGIRQGAIRSYITGLGLKEKDIEFSPENLYAENRKIVEPTADRYYFVPKPVKLSVENLPRLKLRIPLHKDFKDRGTRDFDFGGNGEFYVPEADVHEFKKGDSFRLMNFAGVRVNNVQGGSVHAQYVEGSAGPMVELLEREKDTAKERQHIVGAKKVQWVPADGAINADILSPGGNLSGACESACGKLRVDDVIQFERIGFCRLDLGGGKLLFCFGHN